MTHTFGSTRIARAARITRLLGSTAILALGSMIALVGCGSKSNGRAGSGASGVDGAKVSTSNEERFDGASRGLTAHLKLDAYPHLAELYANGWWIDLGGPEQAKFTVGDWRNGWGSRGRDGDVSFANAGMRGRVYFALDKAEATTVTVRLRPVGTRAMTPYVNGAQLTSVFFNEAPGFSDYALQLTAEQVRVGENELLLTFGGTVDVNGEKVSAAVDAIRIEPTSASKGAPSSPASVRVSKVGLNGDARDALVAPAGSTVRYYVQVPQSAEFSASVANQADVVSHVRVTAQSDAKGPKTLFEGPVGKTWKSIHAELAEFAGEVVRIDLTSSSGASATQAPASTIAWNAPTIWVRGSEPLPANDKLHTHKNLIILLVDTLRADKVHAINSKTRVKSPAFDEFATKGVVFEQARSPENWTKPSVASVLTGLHPLTHRQKTQESSLPQSALLLSEHLKANGFTTGGFSANGFVSGRFGFEQGWDFFTNYIREQRSTDAPDVFKEVGDWIEKVKDQRFFVYIQTIDPHVPYDPPGEYLAMYDTQPYEGVIKPRQTGELLEKAKRKPPAVTFTDRDKQRLEALHDGEISQHDHYFGEFIKRLGTLGLLNDTLIVITADHGEEFEDHGSWGHGHTVYDELLHIPLMIASPHVQQGRRVVDSVSSLAVSPTVTELLGVPQLPYYEATSLTQYLTESGQPAVPPVAFSDFQDERRVITFGSWKLIVKGNLASSMFDLKSDPRERQELDPTAAPIARRYGRAMLGQWLGATNRSAWMNAAQGNGVELKKEDAVMDDTLREQLRALGYAH